MIVNCGHDSYNCENAEKFENVIQELLSNDSVEVWISQNGGKDDCPCLAVLINENNATINYFGEDGSCYSTFNGSRNDGFVTFCDGQYEIHSYQVISKEETLTAVLDFYHYKSRSDAIMWDQLY